MAEKRRTKKRKDDEFDLDKKEPTKAKEEYKVAKWMHKNVASKKTKFAGHHVQYFTGSKAVDALLESPWSKSTKKTDETVFATRQDVVNYLETMLQHKFFHRAKKVIASEQELKAKLKKKEKKVEKEVEIKKEEEAANSQGEGVSKDESPKKLKKIRLEMHYDQTFADNLDAYIWIYTPTPFWYWIVGTLVVLGSIGVCLFPLWPPTVRTGVQYLSMAAAGVLVFILLLAVIRGIVFAIVWVLTWGRLHLWLFPNLTEDVGFFASFWPLYEFEWGVNKKEKGKKKKKLTEIEDRKKLKKGKKGKDGKSKSSIEECSVDSQFSGEEHGEEKGEEKPPDTSQEGEEDETGNTVKNRDEERNSEDSSETDTESSQQSQTGKDFEIVENEGSDDDRNDAKAKSQ